MKLRRRLLSSGLAAAAVVFTACSQDGTDSILSPVDGVSNVVETGYIDVAKVGPAGTYSFSATETGSGLYAPTFSVVAGGSRTIWSSSVDGASSDVTVTELPSEGTQLDSVLLVVYTNDVQTMKTKYTGTNSVTVAGVSNLSNVFIKFFNSAAPPPPPPPPPGGTEGCTPGYWKQSHHFDSWVGYLPTDSFGAVFGVDYPGTLLDAAKAGGGGVKAMGRHAVAALLNASSSVDYAANTAGVIAAVQAAFASGDFETQKNIFERWNELGCPLN